MEISPIERMKILSCYKEIQDVLKGNIPVPRTVEFFISDVCNHNCKGCHSKVLHAMDANFLDISKAKEIVDEIAVMGVEGIEISGGGEPLLYPQIIEFIKHVNSRKLKAGLITNGTLIKEEMIDDLLSNLLFIRIAFDAGSRETYNEVHGVDQYEQLLQIVRKLVARRTEKNYQVTIGLKYLTSQHNYKDILKATQLAHELGVDYIQFKPLRNSEGHAIVDVTEVDRLLGAAKKLATDKFMVLGSTDKSTIKHRCLLNVLHPLVDASGDVFLCAFFQHRMDTHRIGNLHQNSFKDIWYSDLHREAMRNTDHHKCNFFDCPFHSANEIVQQAMVDGKMHLEFV